MNNIDLSLKSDLELVNEVKNNQCSDCFNEICKRYQKIYYDVCHKYFSIFEKKGLSLNDFLEEKNILIYDCIKSFDPSRKTKLSSHISNYGRFLILNSLNSKKNFLATETNELNEYIEDIQTKNSYFSSDFKKDDIDFISDILGNLKDKRIKDIIYLRHFSDKKNKKWKNISKQMRLSVQSCLILYKKGIFILNNKLKSEKYSDII